MWTTGYSHLTESLHSFVKSLYQFFFAVAPTFDDYAHLSDVDALHLPDPTV